MEATDWIAVTLMVSMVGYALGAYMVYKRLYTVPACYKKRQADQ